MHRFDDDQTNDLVVVSSSLSFGYFVVCELLAISASAPVDVRLSFARLAAHGGLDGHPHGWGLGFADGLDAQVWRDAHAAADSPWVACLEQHPVQSRLVVAHIRRATQGDIKLANTQPFVRELWGRVHVFAHNGNLLGLSTAVRNEREHFRPIGETDSEIAFCAFLNEIEQTDASSKSVRQSFANTVRQLREFGPANILYASNNCVLAHSDRRRQPSGEIAAPGLWLLERTCDGSESADDTATPYDLVGQALKVAIVASVPLTDEPWQPVTRGSVLAIEAGEITHWR